MRKYNFTLAKKIINTYIDLGILVRATLGFHEDWFWTAEEVWAKGEYTNEGLKDYTEGQELKVMGLDESKWATPVILLECTDDSELYFNCYTGEWDMDPLDRIKWMNGWTDGPVSSEVQNLRDELEIKNFEG